VHLIVVDVASLYEPPLLLAFPLNGDFNQRFFLLALTRVLTIAPPHAQIEPFPKKLAFLV